MHLRFGTLADWAGPGAAGKLIIVGMFGRIIDAAGVRPIALPPCYLVAMFEAESTEGARHVCSIQRQDMDGRDLIQPMTATVEFVPQGPGRRLSAHVFTPLFGLRVPTRGEYAFRFLQGDRYRGSVPFEVIAPPAT